MPFLLLRVPAGVHAGEQQQTRWVVFGIMILIAANSLLPAVFNFFFPTYASQPNIPSSVFIGLLNYPVVLLALPVTIGIAVLRSRLWISTC